MKQFFNNIPNWFNKWEWLKCSSEQWNYARIMGLVCIVYQFTINSINPKDYHFDNIITLLYELRGFTMCLALFIVEIIRDYRNVKIRLGDKEINFDNEK
jgi:endo-1,4-beta-mannosidase